MLILEIPTWLEDKQINASDCALIRHFASEVGMASFHDLRKLPNLHTRLQEMKLASFIRLMHLLGLYGVIFHRGWSSYGRTASDNAVLLSVDSSERLELRDSKLPQRYLAFFASFDLTFVRSLNGIGLDVMARQLDVTLEDLQYSFLLAGYKSGTVNGDDRWSLDAHTTVPVHSLVSRQSRIRDGNNDNEPISTVRNLPIELSGLNHAAQKLLKKIRVRTTDQLASLSQADLLAVKDSRPATVKHIVAQLDKVLICRKAPIDEPDCSLNDRHSDAPTGNGAKAKDWMSCSTTPVLDLSEIPIQQLGLNHRAFYALYRAGIRTVAQLVALQEEDILSLRNCAKGTLTEITWRLRVFKRKIGEHIVLGESARKDAKPLSQTAPDQGQMFMEPDVDKSPLSDESFSTVFGAATDLLQSLELRLSTVMPPGHAEVFFERRLAVKSSTLLEIGTRRGVSRERIRQIQKEAEETIKNVLEAHLSPLEKAIMGHLNSCGGVISVPSRLDAGEKRKLKALFDVAEVSFVLDEEIDVVWDRAIFSDEEFDQRILHRVNQALPQNGNSFQVHELSAIINGELWQRNAKSSTFDQQALLLVAQRFAERNLQSCEGGWLSRQKCDPQAVTAEQFKQLYPSGAEILRESDELCRTLSAALPELKDKFNKRYVYNLLAAHEDVYLWGQGRYIHKDNVNYDISAVREAISDCITKFDQGISIFKVGALFGDGKRYIAANIPTQQALYSLLRAYAPKRIRLIEYPKLQDGDVILDPSDTAQVARFVMTSGSVAYKELVRHFKQRGWRQSRPFNRRCPAAERLLSMRTGWWLARKPV